jgi:hypothetical protein
MLISIVVSLVYILINSISFPSKYMTVPPFYWTISLTHSYPLSVTAQPSYSWEAPSSSFFDHWIKPFFIANTHFSDLVFLWNSFLFVCGFVYLSCQGEELWQVLEYLFNPLIFFSVTPKTVVYFRPCQFSKTRRMEASFWDSTWRSWDLRYAI